MKYLTSAAAAMILAMQFASPLRADNEKHMRMDPQQAEQHREKRLEMLTKKLNLTPQQQQSVKAIFDQRKDKADAIEKEAMEKRKAIHDEIDAEISKVLTDDQRKTFEQWKAERKEHFEKRMDERGK